MAVGVAAVASPTCTATAPPRSTRWQSPARWSPRRARIGLTHLAITDHERIDGALRARDLARART